jgi:hypothetical protein
VLFSEIYENDYDFDDTLDDEYDSRTDFVLRAMNVLEEN